MLIARRFHRRGRSAARSEWRFSDRGVRSYHGRPACPDFCQERVSERAGRRPRHYRVGRFGTVSRDARWTPASPRPKRCGKSRFARATTCAYLYASSRLRALMTVVSRLRSSRRLTPTSWSAGAEASVLARTLMASVRPQVPRQRTSSPRCRDLSRRSQRSSQRLCVGRFRCYRGGSLGANGVLGIPG